LAADSAENRRWRRVVSPKRPDAARGKERQAPDGWLAASRSKSKIQRFLSPPGASLRIWEGRLVLRGGLGCGTVRM
jgi:hypothetical protein